MDFFLVLYWIYGFVSCTKLDLWICFLYYIIFMDLFLVLYWINGLVYWTILNLWMFGCLGGSMVTMYHNGFWQVTRMYQTRIKNLNQLYRIGLGLYLYHISYRACICIIYCIGFGLYLYHILYRFRAVFVSYIVSG